MAQLGARFNGIEEVAGSTPASSTKFLPHLSKPVPRAPQLECSLNQARERVRAVCREISRPENIETVPLAAAAQRWLAAAIVADRDQPPFDRSLRDGYAVRAAETLPGQYLPVFGLVAAGQEAARLPAGAAFEIMTGAAVPEGADAVLMLEHAETREDGIVARRHNSVGENIAPRGSEARAGEAILAPGQLISVMGVALLAALGHDRVAVRERPRVAIVSTGNEIVEAEINPQPTQIRNSNGPALAALVERSGGSAWRLPIVRDEIEELRKALRETAQAPLTLITGGVSRGRFDLVEEALLEAGGKILFDAVRIRPGRPAVLAQMPASNGEATRLVFGLPGNPVSAMLGFRMLAQPALAWLAGGGEEAWDWPGRECRLAETWRGAGSELTRFLPAREVRQGENTLMELVTYHGSGDLAAMARADGWIMIPENREELPASSPAQFVAF